MLTPTMGNTSTTVDTHQTGARPVPSTQVNSNATLTARAVNEVSQAVSAGEPPPREVLEQAIEKLQDLTKAFAQDLTFALDDESGRTVVKVIDKQTQEVVRQIPSEEALAITRSISKNLGNFIRDKA
ncbi:flagellar protein FlaG [Noviherbaspirillum malthae]|uniref:flagellar protein FlaG n=1 Tax=Noviherbaspirillum malthae TaxID=1260987 RepID=UPI001E558D2F|nr:flagellar protein FlaG [Noviherbaspirillum malthae]